MRHQVRIFEVMRRARHDGVVYRTGPFRQAINQSAIVWLRVTVGRPAPTAMCLLRFRLYDSTICGCAARGTGGTTPLG